MNKMPPPAKADNKNRLIQPHE